MGSVPIVTVLAGDAKAHAGYCRPARLRYCGTTVRTLAEGLTLRQAAPGATNAVLYGRVNLLVDRVVSCPAGSHLALLKKDQSAENCYRWQMGASQARCATRPYAAHHERPHHGDLFRHALLTARRRPRLAA